MYQLVALQEVWVQVIHREQDKYFEVVPFEWMLSDVPLSTRMRFHMQPGQTLGFKNVQAGDNPYATLARDYPMMFRWEEAERLQ